MEKVFELYIRCTPEQLWRAITDPETRARYNFGVTVASEWTPGSAFTTRHPRAPGDLTRGVNVVVDPPRRLVQSTVTLWSPADEAQGATLVTWEIEPVGDSCRLVLTHGELTEDAPETMYGGWPMVLSGLKTWLETGTELTTPGSLAYSA